MSEKMQIAYRSVLQYYFCTNYHSKKGRNNYHAFFTKVSNAEYGTSSLSVC